MPPGHVGPQYDIPTDQRWMARALCHEVDPELFHPSGTPSHATVQARAAKSVCAKCPVREDCLDYALTAWPRPEGVWGGSTDAERREMRRRSA